MTAEVNSVEILGVSGQHIRVEVDLLRRLPSISIVGLARHSVKESTERVRSALNACGYEVPRKRIVINLAPASVPKKGTGLDLPIAIGILAASGQIDAELSPYLFVGELSLSGRLRPVAGAISMAELAVQQGRTLIVSDDSASVAKCLPNVNVMGANTLTEVVELITGLEVPRPISPLTSHSIHKYPDLSSVRGQLMARRALELSAAGAHHLLLCGPPGCGKSMLARRLPGILPPITHSEAIECLKLRAVHNNPLEYSSLMRQRPFRAPHHSSTIAAMIGDKELRPGEISLAHRGVLFLDEAPEFNRNVIEALREPLQERQIRISRAAGTAVLPASIILILAANPCPCGYRNSNIACTCTDSSVNRYRTRLSGPILDRIDLQVDLNMPTPKELFSDGATESSQTVRSRVQAAREFQRDRGQLETNSVLATGSIGKMPNIRASTLRGLERSMETLNLSARSCTKILSVARTIADLEQSVWTDPRHLAEALAFRPNTLPAKPA